MASRSARRARCKRLWMAGIGADSVSEISSVGAAVDVLEKEVVAPTLALDER